MFDFRITAHLDYHGDPMVFTIDDEEGYERGRFVSEAEALEWLPYLEALAEDEERDPPQGREVVVPAAAPR